MKKNTKIYLLKDRSDYIKKLSDDDIINVIGTKGSGKTTRLINIFIMMITLLLIVIDYMTCQRIAK